MNLSHADRRYLSAAAGAFLCTGLFVTALDAMEAAPPIEVDKPGAVISRAVPLEPFDAAKIVSEALAHAQPPAWYWEDVPLSPELQAVLAESCAAHGVPLELALGVIEVESCFRPDADNGHDYGLMQLNREYFPENLSPADNIRAGVRFLGELLATHGDPAAALTCYNAGWDIGDREYANLVLPKAEKWRRILI